jgi:RimJ/RimL family protein N-acetyltransferase
MILAKGDKVWLRSRTLDDIPLLLKWNKADNQAKLFDAPWEKKEADDEFIARMTKSIEKEKSGKIFQGMITDLKNVSIGTVNSYGDKGNSDHRYVGISIYEDALISKGFGMEALKLWIDYLFKTFNLHHIGLETWSFNKRMIRVAEKLGFRNEGCERELRKWDEEWLDKIHYGILRKEWKEI